MVGTTCDVLQRVNQNVSAEFVQQYSARQQFRQEHRTELLWLRCMDSRANPSYIFQGVPVGIWRSYQNMGAKFSVRLWRLFHDNLKREVEYLKEHDRTALFVIADHFSAVKEFGCKGHDYEQARARAANAATRFQLDSMFDIEPGRGDVAAICVSINTDNDSIIFLNRAGEELNTLSMLRKSNQKIIESIDKFYRKELSLRIRQDLGRYAVYNVRHVEKVTQFTRTLTERSHHESVIVYGESPEAFCLRGEGLTISPYIPPSEFFPAMKGAIGILDANREQYGLRPQRKFVFVAAAPYYPDPKNPQATEKRAGEAKVWARALADRGVLAVREYAQDSALLDSFEYLTAVVNKYNMRAEIFV